MSLANVAEIDAFVTDERLPEIESQIIQNNAILARLEGKNRYIADGGEHIRAAARYQRLPSGAYARGKAFSTEQRETVKEYILPWVMYYVDVTIDGWSRVIMSGRNAIRNFVADKMDNARETMSYNLNRGMVVYGGEDNELTGFPAFCDDGTNYASYGQITKATYTWAKGYLNSTGGAYTNSMFQTAYGEVSKNNEHPDIILTDQDVYNSVWNKMTPQQRFPSERHADIRALGFDGIESTKGFKKNFTISVDIPMYLWYNG